MRRRMMTERDAGMRREVRCAAYVRTAVMGDDAATQQRKEAAALMRRHDDDGWVLVEPAYEDLGVSGCEANRPALGRLLADVEAGRVDVVVAADPARFGRSARLVAETLERFAAHGVTVAFAVSGEDGAAPSQPLGLLRSGLPVQAP